MAFSPLILLLIPTTFLLQLTSATKLGITYTPTTTLPPSDHVVTKLHSLQITAVRILDPTPAAVRAFAFSNISVALTVPNHLLPAFAANTTAPHLWLYNNVLPFHPRTKISIISVGLDPLSDPHFEPSDILLPAIRNLHQSLIELGIKTIPVSTTFSFTSIISKPFPPSSAEFTEPVNSVIINLFLKFLEETNSSFLVNVFPYKVFQSDSEIPVGFALFQEHAFNFRDDLVTGVRYWNLFDMMLDSVIAAMAVTGNVNIPVIVSGTGWPSNEAHAEGNYAEMYLEGLVSHVRSGSGTPLRKEGAAEVYVYQMFDDDSGAGNLTKLPAGTTATEDSGLDWGILYPNMTSKYNLSFTTSGGGKMLMQVDTGALMSRRLRKMNNEAMGAFTIISISLSAVLACLICMLLVSFCRKPGPNEQTALDDQIKHDKKKNTSGGRICTGLSTRSSE